MLSAPLLVAGAALAAGGLAVAVRRLDYERIPEVAVLAAAFFVVSLVSIPVGPSAVHLLLNGLIGIILGWAAVPALLVGLVLQLVFFGYGGLLVLGVNTSILALPALLCGAAAPLLGRLEGRALFAAGAVAGALSVALTAALVALALGLSDTAYHPAAKVILVTYIPLMVVESVITGFAVVFIRRVAPELLRLGAQPHG